MTAKFTMESSVTHRLAPYDLPKLRYTLFLTQSAKRVQYQNWRNVLLQCRQRFQLKSKKFKQFFLQVKRTEKIQSICKILCIKRISDSDQLRHLKTRNLGKSR